MALRQWPVAGPSRRMLVALALGALLVHALLLLGVTAPLELRLSAPAPSTSVQVRVVQPPLAAPAPRPLARPPGRPPVAEPTPPMPEEAAAPPHNAASEPVPVASESLQVAAVSADPPMAAVSTAASVPVPARDAAWPLISLGALPISQVLNYQLSGMDKGLHYHASGELRWQHNDTAYDLSLSVRAFLLGRRQWRSVGQIDATGLAPRRFSDSWRNERAAHFDREQQRVVFSSNSTPAPLQPGAQDQVSLYVQLAAAMAGEPERFAPGTRLQVQTATVRDALPWSLVLESNETLVLDGQKLQTARWVCQPRNQFEARVEFWVAASQAWMPVRIRITQASGSYIDLLWRSTEPLPPLPAATDTTMGTRGS